MIQSALDLLANFSVPLQHGHAMPHAAQLVACRQTSKTSTYYKNIGITFMFTHKDISFAQLNFMNLTAFSRTVESVFQYLSAGHSTVQILLTSHTWNTP